MWELTLDPTLALWAPTAPRKQRAGILKMAQVVSLSTVRLVIITMTPVKASAKFVRLVMSARRAVKNLFNWYTVIYSFTDLY